MIYIRLIWPLILLHLAMQVSAQCFVANQTRGCVPLTVNMTLTDTCATSGSIPGFNYGDGGGQGTFNFNHTYTNPGVYSVTFGANFSGGAQFITKQNYITVLDTPAPQFRIIKCSGRGIVVEILNPVYEQYMVNYGDSPPVPNDTITIANTRFSDTHSYANTNTRTITVRGNYLPGNCGASSSQTVTPVNTIGFPVLLELSKRVTSLTNGHNRLRFNTESGMRYVIQRRDNNTAVTSFLDTIFATANTFQYEDLGMNNLTNDYCYRIFSLDGCLNKQFTTELCSFKNLNVTAENNRNRISWSRHANDSIESHRIFRIGTTNPLFDTTDLTTTVFFDSSVQCNVQYCYFLRSEGKSSGFTISDTLCATAFSTTAPTAPQQVFSTVEGNEIVLGFSKLNTTGIRSNISTREASPGGTVQINIGNDTFFRDKQVNTATTRYCYTLRITDSCGNQSPISEKTCPILLTGRQITVRERELEWTGFFGFDTLEKEYTIEKFDENGTIYSSVNVGNSLIFNDDTRDTRNQTVRYRVKARTINGGSPFSFSNVISFEQPLRIYFPDAFSPNGDGNNDIFAPQGRFISTFKMNIFNRLGELLFQSDSFSKGWDGVLNGKYVQPDVYVYTYEATDENGNSISGNGTITVIR